VAVGARAIEPIARALANGVDVGAVVSGHDEFGLGGDGVGAGGFASAKEGDEGAECGEGEGGMRID
jgi:hypothetical protein